MDLDPPEASDMPVAAGESSDASVSVLRFAPLLAEVGREDASEMEPGDATEQSDSASENVNGLSGACVAYVGRLILETMGWEAGYAAKSEGT